MDQWLRKIEQNFPFYSHLEIAILCKITQNVKDVDEHFRHMTKSDSSPGWLFRTVDSAMEGLEGALQIGSGNKPWMVFLPSLPPAPSVSRESGLHLASCFLQWCNRTTPRYVESGQKMMQHVGMRSGTSFITTEPGPWRCTVVLESCCPSRQQLGNLQGGPPDV